MGLFTFLTSSNRLASLLSLTTSQSSGSSGSWVGQASQNQSFWAKLSAIQKADCVGRLRTSLCCSQYAWNVQGLLEELWITVLESKIKSLYEANYASIHPRGGRPFIAFNLYLLSPILNPDHAQPTIVIRVDNKSAGEKARKLLESHPLIQDLNSGILVRTEVEMFVLVGRDSFNVTNSSISLASQSGTQEYRVNSPTMNALSTSELDSEAVCSLVGQSIVISNPLLRPVSSFTYATVCSVVNFDGRWYALLPLHPLRVAAKSQSKLAFFSADLQLIGHIDPRLSAEHFSQVNDYVLVGIENKKFWSTNQTVVWSGISIDSGFKHPNLENRPAKAILATGTSGTREVNITSTKSQISFPWSDGLHSVLELECTLNPGDSGSPLLALDGNILGMAVATSPSANISYAIPGNDILKSLSNHYSTASITRSDKDSFQLSDTWSSSKKHASNHLERNHPTPVARERHRDTEPDHLPELPSIQRDDHSTTADSLSTRVFAFCIITVLLLPLLTLIACSGIKISSIVNTWTDQAPLSDTAIFLASGAITLSFTLYFWLQAAVNNSVSKELDEVVVADWAFSPEEDDRRTSKHPNAQPYKRPESEMRH